MQPPFMTPLAQAIIEKETVELLVNAGAITLVLFFAIGLVIAAIMLIRFLGSRGKGNEDALQTMSLNFNRSQERIDELEREVEQFKTRETERSTQWLEVVQNNTSSQIQFADAMSQFFKTDSEWRQKQVDLQQATIDKLDALNLNFVNWPKSATETARVMADELRGLQEKIETLPEKVIESLRPVLLEFGTKMESEIAKFKSENALDSSTPIDTKQPAPDV